MNIDLRKKTNSEIPWIDSDCRELYNGRYSRCLEKKGIVRKYFVHDNHRRFKDEYKMMVKLYEEQITIPKPLNFGYDAINSKWYIESEFLPSDPIPEVLNRPIFNMICDLVSKIEKIKYIDNNNWNRQLDDFERALQLYGKEKNEPVESILSLLKSKNPSVFIHGDFLPKNLGLSQQGIVVFDLQNSGMGPANWDLCYFLSAFDPGFINKEVKVLISDEWLETIISILKIRIGRAIRKELYTGELETNMHAWEKIERAGRKMV